MFSPVWGQAPDVAKPVTTEKSLVSITAKRQLLETDSNNIGVRGKSRSKEFTIRVEVQNITNNLIEHAALTGEVFVSKVIREEERMVSERLAKKEIPTLKPGEKVTIDLGKITLNTIEFRSKSFEEKLEEWKVECLDGQKIIGSTLSSEKFTKLQIEAKENPVVNGPAPFRKPLRKLGK
jgi:hypothetical protein